MRPVPKVTVDFGDGRVLERTLTGNSIHYVLDEQGQVLDGLPGLYSPQRFEAWLQEMQQWATQVKDARKAGNEKAIPEILKTLHTQKVADIARAWRRTWTRFATRLSATKLPRSKRGLVSPMGESGLHLLTPRLG